MACRIHSNSSNLSRISKFKHKLRGTWVVPIYWEITYSILFFFRHIKVITTYFPIRNRICLVRNRIKAIYEKALTFDKRTSIVFPMNNEIPRFIVALACDDNKLMKSIINSVTLYYYKGQCFLSYLSLWNEASTRWEKKSQTEFLDVWNEFEPLLSSH